jgi:hypothetical protein
LLAGPVQPGNEEFFAKEVEPHIDGDRLSTSARWGRRRQSCTWPPAPS